MSWENTPETWILIDMLMDYLDDTNRNTNGETKLLIIKLSQFTEEEIQHIIGNTCPVLSCQNNGTSSAAAPVAETCQSLAPWSCCARLLAGEDDAATQHQQRGFVELVLPTWHLKNAEPSLTIGR